MTDLPTRLDPAVEKTLRRLHISKHDFAHAGTFITAARQHPVFKIEHEALLLSAIICYARPFGPNEKAVEGGEMQSDPTLDPSSPNLRMATILSFTTECFYFATRRLHTRSSVETRCSWWRIVAVLVMRLSRRWYTQCGTCDTSRSTCSGFSGLQKKCNPAA